MVRKRLKFNFVFISWKFLMEKSNGTILEEFVLQGFPDLLLLTAMSIDRCVAICYPLRYSSIMINSVCVSLIIGCLIPPFFTLLYPTIILANLPFCGHVLNHFYCESAAMLKLICVDISVIKLNTILSSVLILFGCLIITTVSYILIVVTVIRMPTDTGRQKTFSTCISHLTMLSIFFGSAIFILIRPPKDYSVENDKIVNLVSTVLAPLLNPFVYTLRNEKVKTCIQDALKQTIFS
ncbi:olfactory receptor 6M1-like [Anomaloglossus baeobatrachus]